MPLSTIGFITKDRPRLLARALAGFLENARAFGRNPAAVVIDGSAGGGCALALAALKARYGLPLFYAGARERTRFARRLIGLGIAPQDARFALEGGVTGSTFGAQRNALMLDSPDQALLMCDDDVACEPGLFPEAREGDQIAWSGSPDEFWFFADRASAMKAVSFEPRDALALHERFLGRSVRSHEGKSGVVAATISGVVGDCALASPRSYLRLAGSSRERLTRSHGSYGAALSRQVVRGVRRPTVSSAGGFVSTVVAIDNRQLLAPFPPSLRNEDGVFGTTLGLCRPDKLWLHIPWVMPHLPPRRRPFSKDDFGAAGRDYRVNDLLQHCLSSLHAGTGDGRARLKRLGREVGDIARLPGKDFRRLVRLRIDHARALQILGWEALLKKHGGAPGFWAEDVRRCIASLEAALVAARQAPPADLPGGEERRWRELQRFAGRFGRLLAAWPDIIEASRRLRAEGVRLCRPI